MSSVSREILVLIIFKGEVINSAMRSMCHACFAQNQEKVEQCWDLVLKILKLPKNCVHFAVSFQCKYWAEVHRGVRCQCPFLVLFLYVLKHVCKYICFSSSACIQLTGPALHYHWLALPKFNTALRNPVRSTVLLKKTPWNSGTQCMSCLNGHFLREHMDCNFPPQYKPLLWGNVSVKS